MDARDVLQALRRAAEDQPAGGRGRADGREARQDRHRAGAGLRCVEARPGRGQGHRRRAEARRRTRSCHGSRRRSSPATRSSRTAGCSFTKTGVYGTSYRERALITWYRPGREPPPGRGVSDRPKVRICSRSTAARTSTWCTSTRAKCRRSTAFWSITMYDEDYFFVPNPINRYTVSSAQQAQDQRRRLGRPLHPARFARQGQGAELAARADRRIRADDAAVLAHRKAAVHPRRHVEAARGEGGFVTSYAFIYARTLRGTPERALQLGQRAYAESGAAHRWR